MYLQQECHYFPVKEFSVDTYVRSKMETINAENLILQELTTLLRKLTGIYIFSQKTAEDSSQSPNANSVHAVSGLPCHLTYLPWANEKKRPLGNQSVEKVHQISYLFTQKPLSLWAAKTSLLSLPLVAWLSGQKSGNKLILLFISFHVQSFVLHKIISPVKLCMHAC